MRGLVISQSIQDGKDLFVRIGDRPSDGIHPGINRPNSLLKKGRGGQVKVIVWVAVLLFVFFSTLGAGSMKSKTEEVELAGKVYVMGNEPFTQVGLKADDGEVYVLQGEQEKQLRAFQGKRLSIKGKPSQEKVRGANAVEVKSFKVLE